ncbi:MAG: hypothetical protein ACI9VR_002613 [Cognaticolwellia sp.]
MRSPTLPPVVVLLTLLAPLLALAICWWGLGGVPHVSDEVAYTLQSRIFAAGARVGPPGDVPSMLTLPFWETRPVSYAIFPPGWPALLASGEIFGVPWLVNPLLLSLVPSLSWLLAREAVEEEVAQLAAGIAALSPGVLLLAGSRMAHTSVLVALLVLAVVVARARDHVGLWLMAGVAAGYTVLARPFDAALVAGPLLLVGLYRGQGPERLALLLGPLLATGLLAWDNQSLSGSAWVFPSAAYFDSLAFEQGLSAGCNRLGFGEDVGCVRTLGTAGHTPEKALHFGWLSLQRLDRLLLGLPGLGLVCVLGIAVLKERAIPLVAAVLLVVLGYALYWSPGGAYGARFYHSLYLVLPMLAAAGLYRFLGRLSWGLVLAGCTWGGINLTSDLAAEPYWCVSGALSETLREHQVSGVLLVKAIGRRKASWPSLLMEDFVCTPELVTQDALMLLDPMHPTGGLQPRHALSSGAEVDTFMSMHPDSQKWAAGGNIEASSWTLYQDSPSGWQPMESP